MLLHEITLKNVLSFGPEGLTLPLRRLNVLIGPNGSGKSNLLEAINLLRSSATGFSSVFTGEGASPVVDWLWKKQPGTVATIDAVIDYPQGKLPLRHTLEFTEQSGAFRLVDERIENAKPFPGHDEPYFYYRYQRGQPVLLVRQDDRRHLVPEGLAPDESILSQRKDPDQYPELGFLAWQYQQVRIYNQWSFGRQSVFRRPQDAALRRAPLAEDFSNLGLFLNYLRTDPQARQGLLEHLRDLYTGLQDVDVEVRGGTVELYVLEEGKPPISAKRLSDGTLRYLALLAILLDPDPPALVCIEEPELGLHPDLLPKLADLMMEASERMQLIVTTHSDILVDAFSERPEDVVIVERPQDQSRFRRLEKSEQLVRWLEQYRLGELWIQGELGGTRW